MSSRKTVPSTVREVSGKHEDRLLDVMDIFHRRVTVAEEMCPDYKDFQANQTLFEADLRHQVTMQPGQGQMGQTGRMPVRPGQTSSPWGQSGPSPAAEDGTAP